MSHPNMPARGRRLRQYRLQYLMPDGRPMTQEQLAQAAGISKKTVQRAEHEGRASKRTLTHIFEVLGVLNDERRRFEEEFNPLRSERGCLDEEEHWKIKKQVRDNLLEVAYLPAFIMDEFWFVRAFNIHILALHGIRPEQLNSPDAWHAIAIKFNPTLGMKEVRGPDWRQYYLIAIKRFHDAVALHNNTDRYHRMLRWLRKHKEVILFWNRVRREGESDYRARLHESLHIPVCWETNILWWNEVGGEFYPSLYLPGWLRSVWLPTAKTGENREMPQILVDMKLGERAEKMGYDPRGKPLHFIEEYISEDILREIGGWIE